MSKVQKFGIGDLVTVNDCIGVVDDIRSLGPNNELLPRVVIRDSVKNLFREQYRVRDTAMHPILSSKHFDYPNNKWLDADELALVKHGPLYELLETNKEEA